MKGSIFGSFLPHTSLIEAKTKAFACACADKAKTVGRRQGGLVKGATEQTQPIAGDMACSWYILIKPRRSSAEVHLTKAITTQRWTSKVLMKVWSEHRIVFQDLHGDRCVPPTVNLTSSPALSTYRNSSNTSRAK